jgi:prepilin-type N-terminal cleavage/methylation domain-containing protein
MASILLNQKPIKQFQQFSEGQEMKRMQQGFTLVEIAIVLVIIGLLLGGILKGQELITNARVRNVADQQSAVKAAFYAFQDRFRALPGDYAQADTNIPNIVATRVGNGNSRVEAAESVLAWYHLTNAGFISCSSCAADPGAAATPLQNNSPTNAYNGVMQIIFDNVYAGTATNANNLKSGIQIPSNVLVEVDRKIDDGVPTTGSFRFSVADPVGGGTAPAVATCLRGGATWEAQSPDANCGAASLL